MHATCVTWGSGGKGSEGQQCFPCTCDAEEGAPQEQIVYAIGDKGRAQLTRAEGKKFQMCFTETYKAKVTFAQVRGRG